ncbi:dynamin like protein [Heterostelium album PN500]|uniref:Dynamin like protein n=1 Tax=Heterostelium pallidum (strain ATCC 26659 / Pp 5 / PN500) TaxID=670386 RepID=D3B450_HETP5|nr:dynamin like protein [Heterostelium album PN500]EFA84098.1 dynamin like protein [Heterostelium album PN500]|eukprot:XP_020436215.1 dynamin like protein [Heterostelium album PN500]
MNIKLINNNNSKMMISNANHHRKFAHLEKKLETTTPVAVSNSTTPNGANTPTVNPSGIATTFTADDDRLKKEEEEKRKKAEEQKRKEEEERVKREKDAAAEQKRKEEEERKKSSANEEINEEFEIQSLEQMGKSNVGQDMFTFFPGEVYGAYDKLQSFSRDLNTSIPQPEIVFVGPRGSGKSSLIESFIGRPLNIVGAMGCSKRALHLQFVNNTECETPKITIKRDGFIKEFDHDVVIPIEQLNDTITRRNTAITEEPIYIMIEAKNTLNLTLIDTPGLVAEGTADQAKIDAIVNSILRPTHRLIVAVEACGDWSNMTMLSFVKRVDPELSRSTFVFTKFFNIIQDFNSTRSVNRFLAGTMSEIKSFFVTIPNHKIRARFSEPANFQEKLTQAYKRDMNALEQLQYDKRYERNIGVHPFRRYILNITWKYHQDAVPRILKHLRSKRQSAESSLSDLQKQSASLDSTMLRAVASNYTVTFLQITEKLLAGTSEGNPSVNGQTLDEEKQQQGDGGDWVDLYNRPIKFDAEEWGIPYWNSKLYGGQQFERLMGEFKAVCDNTKITEVTLDDVATASGINKLNNIPNYAWAACDLAQQKSQDALVPLIEQLCERAVYIMKRLADVTDKVIDSRKKNRVTSTAIRAFDIENIDQYPYFTHHVKDLFYKFIEHSAKVCKEKCMDEFYSTRTIYWELTEHPDQSLPFLRTDHQDTKSTVELLTTQLFDTIRKRITKNVLLKFYNFFLVPMQTDLWTEIQGKITCLANESLEQIFEVNATKEQLKEDEKKQQSILEKYTQNDDLFLKAASQFNHPLSSATIQ